MARAARAEQPQLFEILSRDKSTAAQFHKIDKQLAFLSFNIVDVDLTQGVFYYIDRASLNVL